MVYKIRFLKQCIQIEFNQQVNKLQFRGDLLILPYTCPQFEARLLCLLGRFLFAYFLVLAQCSK